MSNKQPINDPVKSKQYQAGTQNRNRQQVVGKADSIGKADRQVDNNNHNGNIADGGNTNGASSWIADLYFSTEDEYCIALIQLIYKVPFLKDVIRCRDIYRHPIRQGIDSIPTIDDGSTDENGRPVFHKHEQAFNWVVMQCYNLLSAGNPLGVSVGKDVLSVEMIDKERVLGVEKFVQDLIRQFAMRQTSENIRDKEIMRQHLDEQNPLDRYGSGHETALFGTSRSDNDKQQKTKYLYQEYLEQHKQKGPPQGSISDRMKKHEQDRENLLKAMKARWDGEGGAKAAEPKTIIERSKLKTNRLLSEVQLKEFESQRQQMLQNWVDQPQTSQLREPLKRQATKLGTNITDSDLQRFEHERNRLAQMQLGQYN